MMTYLLDTNILSEAVKANPDPKVMAKLEKHQHEIVTAAPVWHELLYGCFRLTASRRRETIEAYLENVIRSSMDILPYDDRAAELHAQQRAILSMKGKVPSFVDGQIAAIAAVNGLVLVTRNTQDFEPFENVSVVNWHVI